MNQLMQIMRRSQVFCLPWDVYALYTTRIVSLWPRNQPRACQRSLQHLCPLYSHASLALNCV